MIELGTICLGLGLTVTMAGGPRVSDYHELHDVRTRCEYDAERSPGELSTTYYALSMLARPKVCNSSDGYRTRIEVDTK